ncbi:hypothetical protein VF21_09830 [Pseudogymnoascus sp. 05NY08]|nr:hypothetical protein VF21_09830 [Pseudogymnoascus sp. 05NY08]
MRASMKICLAAVLSTSSWWSHSMIDAKSVFAHYMLSYIDPNTDHAKQDIDQAIAVGLDAFAVNVGAPGAEFSTITMQQLFDYARDKPFKLFFSFDFYAAGDIAAHQEFFNVWRNETAYLTYGPQNLPVLSTFSGGSLGPDVWRNFKETNNVYLLPNVEEGEADYYNNPTAFFQKWGGAIDGVFSWETAWPYASETPMNVTSEKDVAVKNAADAAGKSYMMGLSTLQYKHCCGDSWYRPGEVNLPERMTQILSLKPELTEVMTWNDAGESLYRPMLA